MAWAINVELTLPQKQGLLGTYSLCVSRDVGHPSDVPHKETQRLGHGAYVRHGTHLGYPFPLLPSLTCRNFAWWFWTSTYTLGLKFGPIEIIQRFCRMFMNARSRSQAEILAKHYWLWGKGPIAYAMHVAHTSQPFTERGTLTENHPVNGTMALISFIVLTVSSLF